MPFLWLILLVVTLGLGISGVAAAEELVRQYGLGKVTLTGSDFGEQVGRAMLGGIPMRIEQWTSQEVIARVPSSIAAGKHELVITNAAGSVVTKEAFFVKPNVWTIASEVVDGSTYVELTGSNFGQAGKVRLEMDGVAFAVAEWSNERICLQIGDAVPAGWYRAHLRVDGRRFETGQVGIAPRADRLLPDQGAFVIEGGHLSRDISVVVGETPAEVIAVSSQKVWFSPVAATPGGRHAVRIESQHLVSAPVYLAVEPHIEGLRFASGKIVVEGERFGLEADGGLYLNGNQLPIYAWDNTSVTVGLPPMLKPGEHAIIAKIGGVESSPHFLRLYPQRQGRIVDGKWETPDFEESW